MTDQGSSAGEALGKLVSEYAPRPIATWGGKIAGGLIAVIGGIAVVYGVIAVAQDTRVFCVPLGGLVLTALGVWSYIRAERRTHRRVQVYEHGLVDLERGETRAFPWASVAEVHQAIVTQRDRRTHVALTTHTYTVTDDSGRAATFDDTIEHVQALGEAIQRAVSERLLAEALRALDQGRPWPLVVWQ